MITAQPTEIIDELSCQKHKASIELFTMEENVKVIDQLLCVDCIREKTRIPYSLPWNDVKRMIQEDQQIRANQFELSLKPIIELVKSFQDVIEKIAAQLSENLGIIATTIASWVKEISEQRNNGYKYSLIQELENMINKERGQKLYSIENKSLDALIKCNQEYLSKLQIQLKKTMLSKELSQLQVVVQNLFSRLQGNLLEGNLDQAKTDNAISQTSSIKCLCPEHKTVINMINLEKDIDLKKRTLCVNCELSHVIPTFKFEERWRCYQLSLQQIRNEKLKNLQLDVNETKNQIRQLKQQQQKDFNQIEILLDSQIKNRITLTRKYQFVGNYCNNLEQLQQIVEELSSNEVNKQLVEDREFENNYLQLNQQLNLQFDQLSKSFKGTIENLQKVTQGKIIISSEKNQAQLIDDNQLTSRTRQIDQISYQYTHTQKYLSQFNAFMIYILRYSLILLIIVCNSQLRISLSKNFHKCLKAL